MTMTKTRWRKEEIPSCINDKNHKWKGSDESGVCQKCGYDVFDLCYRKKGER